MTAPGHLIAFTISPVQAFIVEARKAQDIWSGSLLLARMASAALDVFDAAKAKRILPAEVTNAPPHRPSVTNEGVVLLEHGETAAACALGERAAAAARAFWHKLAADTREQLIASRLFDRNELSLWEQQIAGQFNVAWAVEPVGSDPTRALLRLRRLLGAAKRSRCLGAYTGDSRPKCTLSGDWEQMGPVETGADFWRTEFPRRVRLLPGGSDLRWVVTARVEAGGRERLCAPSLTKRLAPALCLGFKNHGNPESPVRFPSTTAVAWIEAKRRLLEQAKERPDTFADALLQFNQAVDAWCRATGQPRGRHVLACHEGILAGLQPPLREVAAEFLRLDGSFLADEDEREVTEGFEEVTREHRRELRDQLRRARSGLADLTRDGTPSVGIGRTPALALIRADADRMGKLSSEVVASTGFDGAWRLSLALGEQALPKAVQDLELKCYGRVLFAGGDELIALVPAAYALKAAHWVASAYEQAGRDRGFPDLGCSVAVLLFAPRSPLRLAVKELNKLLESAKEHRRSENWKEGRGDCTRRGVGIAVVPGSGNIRVGVVGLRVPQTDRLGNVTGYRDTLTDVLQPLADALARDTAPFVSSKLYREWLDLFGGLQGKELDAILPSGGDEGIGLAEFRRLAGRHIQGDAAQVAALVEDLTDRFRSLLLSGSFENQSLVRHPNWKHLQGLLLGITTLGTREIG